MYISELTFGGIKRIVTEQKHTPTIVQVINFQPEEKILHGVKCFVSEISDGYTKIKCYWDEKVYEQIVSVGKQKFNGSIVMIKEYIGTNKTVFVSHFDLMHLMKGEIGQPISYKEYSNGDMNIGSTNKINPDWIEKSYENQNSYNIPTGDKKVMTQLKSQTTFNRKPIEKISASNFQTRIKISKDIQYSSIEMMYAGLLNWSLYGRITKKIFKQFTNRNQKQTKLLEFEIMDKQSWTIKSTIFEKQAEKMRDTLQEGQVYIFSGGMVKLDSYKKPSHSKDSKCSIIFQQHSNIKLAEDDGSIPFAQENTTPIQKISQLSPGIEIDVIGILKSIGPSVPFTLKGKNQESTKRTVILCDPVSQKQCQLTIWRQQISLQEFLINKTIKFESVKTHEYLGGHSLNTWGKTRFSILNNHAFNKFETEIDKMIFTSLSYKKSKEEGKAHISNIRELMYQCDKLQSGQTIWSTFRVYINNIKQAGKKWYHACPNCRKSVVQNVTICSQCNTTFKSPVVRYILNVAISDCLGTGSLWTVAHDDFANKILSYASNCPAEQASLMSEQQFSELCRKCLFQEFKVTLVSKADRFPPSFHLNVRHQITTFNIADHLKEAKQNLERIDKFC